MLAALLTISVILHILGLIEKRRHRKETSGLREELKAIRENQIPVIDLAHSFILLATNEVSRLKDEVNDIKRHTEKQSD